MREKYQRDSRFEFLRILGMIMIVLSHFSIYGNWDTSNISAIGTVRLLAFDGFGPIGAMIFFIISGYFYNKKDINTRANKSRKKAILTWMKTFFYSVIMFLLCLAMHIPIGLKEKIITLFPFSFNEYWFITCYLIITVFSPYIDEVIDQITEARFFKLLLFMFLLMFLELLNNEITNKLLVAFFGYLIGAYLQINRDTIVSKIKDGQLLLVIILGYALDLVSIYICKKVGVSFSKSAHFTQYVLSTIMAVSIFIIVIKRKSFVNIFVNTIALGAFAVYLITEQVSFRHVLWSKILNVGQYQNSHYLYLIGLGLSMLIYFVCASFDIIIGYLFNMFKKWFVNCVKGN